MRGLARWGFVIVGLAVALWGVVAWLNPPTDCRGVPMQPGDVCTKWTFDREDPNQVQTYEDRVNASRGNAPFIMALGLAAMGFGVWVARHPHEQADDQMAQVSNDIGP